MRRDEILSILSSNRDELQGMGVESIGIYGAAARDELGPSDKIEVFVEFHPDAPIGLFGFVDLRLRLGELMGREASLAEPEALREWRRGYYLNDAIYAVRAGAGIGAYAE